MKAEEILSVTRHRPWPLPRGTWVLYQAWRWLLFAHWPVPAAMLRPLVPAPLVLDEREGSAWLGLVPFLITDSRAPGLPPLPLISTFPELNLRTYVCDGERAAVYFFNLDAPRVLAVLGGRAVYRLPYELADMSIREQTDGWIRFESRRRSDGAELRARYRAAGPASPAAAGSLAHFLAERYELITVLRRGRVLRVQIHHAPWPLQSAEAEIERNTVARAAGIALPDVPPLLHYSARQDTLIWAPEIRDGTH